MRFLKKEIFLVYKLLWSEIKNLLKSLWVVGWYKVYEYILLNFFIRVFFFCYFCLIVKDFFYFSLFKVK